MKMKLRISIFLLAILKLLPTDAARILGIFPFQGMSHFVMSGELLRILAKRGHQVDVISHFPQKKTIANYTDIISLEGTAPQLVNNLTWNYLQDVLRASPVYFAADSAGNKLCASLGLPELQKLIENPPKDPPYDLVIMEYFGAHCFLAFGHLLKVPVVALSTCVMYPWMNAPTGNPDNTAYIPNSLLEFSGSMSFWERVQNTLFTIYHKTMFNYYSSPQDDIIKKHFGPDTPGVRELENSIALMLTNSHYSLNGVKPFTPAVVEIGGLHVHDHGPEISPMLAKWLDESEKGFVYFSFGSMMKIESMPREFIFTLYKSLAKISPVRVLMKIVKPEELPPGLPKNVLTSPWIPQFKVLKHRNIRAFVTHGGLMGTQEALSLGVPLIGIPLFGDQLVNIKTYVQKKVAIALDYRELTTEKMDAALNTILNYPEYRKEAKKLSALFLDRPLSAADTAVFWIEYVIRNGPNALRSPVMDLAWWQAALLDVYGVLLLAVLLAGYLLRIITGAVIAVVFGSETKKWSKSKKLV